MISLRQPTATDGIKVNRLVSICPPLDVNSTYCNLLQCTHFAQTSICAEYKDDLVGFISAYCLPDQPDVLFIWQVMVAPSVRGQSLAKKMLLDLVARPSLKHITKIQTTITQSNHSSHALFASAAKSLNATIHESVMFDKHKHFLGEHDSEMLVELRLQGAD